MRDGDKRCSGVRKWWWRLIRYYDNRDGSILPPDGPMEPQSFATTRAAKASCLPRPNRGSESTSHDAKTLSFTSSSLPDFFQQAEDHTRHAGWSRKSN